MKIKLEFSTDNAAFGEKNSPDYCAEVCFVMAKVTSKITNGEPWGLIRDTNGNTIGEFNTLPMEGDEV